MTNPSTYLLTNIGELVGVANASITFRSGTAMDELPTLTNSWLKISEGRIADYGTMDTLTREELLPHEDVGGRMVFPCWCDSHTHIVFAGSREAEFVQRIRGMSYEEIARQGGGILRSAERLQAASEEELLAGAWGRLQEMMGRGTGAIEIKSGYGLTTASELKMLRVIKRLKTMTEVPIKATFLGAHAVPTAYKENRAAYIDLIIHEMLPQIAEEQLADYCDVFCDKGFYTPRETQQIVEAAAGYGLKAKIHANELGHSGGVLTGVLNSAVSVDHLEYLNEEEIAWLLDSQTMPTLLPSTAYFLKLPHYAPARRMIDAGLPVALATDYNPGSSPSGSMPLVLSMACTQMRMTTNEAINAATLNGAKALELEQEIGSITIGKAANFFITRPLPSKEYLVYAFGSEHIESVYIKGKRTYTAPHL